MSAYFRIRNCCFRMDAHVRADFYLNRFIAKVSSPAPNRYCDIYRDAFRMDTHFAVAEVGDWTDVTAFDFVLFDGFQYRVSDFRFAVGHLHAYCICGIEESFDMFF